MPRARGRKPVVTPIVPERLDERSVVVQEMRSWVVEYGQQLGGYDHLPVAKVALLDEAARLAALLQAGWAIVLQDEAPFALEGRERLKAMRTLRVDLLRIMKLLGIEAVASEASWQVLPKSGEAARLPRSLDALDTDPALRENEWEDPPEEYRDGDA
jgi:hypothetical protein